MTLERQRPFPGDAVIPVLTRMAVGDPEPSLHLAATRALRTQKINAAWEASMMSLLDAPDADVRALAATAVERRYDAAILAALRKRLTVETDPAVRVALESAIALQAAH